jgi:hypothetical protein
MYKMTEVKPWELECEKVRVSLTLGRLGML